MIFVLELKDYSVIVPVNLKGNKLSTNPMMKKPKLPKGHIRVRGN